MRHIVNHSEGPQDILLNTAQMRDARIVQPFRIRSPSNLDPDQIITASSIRELALQKVSQEQQAKDKSSPAPPPAQAAITRPTNRLLELRGNAHASSSRT